MNLLPDVGIMSHIFDPIFLAVLKGLVATVFQLVQETID